MLRLLLILFISIFVAGCASDTPPAKFWGGVGAEYEAGSIKRSKKLQNSAGAAHIGFEKSLGGGFGIGGEVAGVRRR